MPLCINPASIYVLYDIDIINFCLGTFCPGTFFPGAFCPGTFYPGTFVQGLLSRDILSGDFLSRDILSGTFCPGTFCPSTHYRISLHDICKILLVSWAKPGKNINILVNERQQTVLKVTFYSNHIAV